MKKTWPPGCPLNRPADIITDKNYRRMIVQKQGKTGISKNKQTHEALIWKQMMTIALS